MNCCEQHKPYGCNQGRECPVRQPMQLHRIDPLELARRQGFLRTADGGHCVSGEDSLRIPAPTESATEQSDTVGLFVLIVAGIAAVLLVAASAFGFLFST